MKRIMLCLLFMNMTSVSGADDDWITNREWPYLTSEALKIRYAIVAYLLRDCSFIVEIGGYKTPISDFVSGKRVIVIDPKIEPKEKDGVIHVPLKLQEWVQPEDLSSYALVILGMDLHLDDPGWSQLLQLIDNADRVVIEFSSSYKPAIKDFETICEHSNKKQCLQVKLDLSGNTDHTYEEFYPYRNICVFE